MSRKTARPAGMEVNPPMRFVTYFQAFMRETVNINQSRLDDLSGAVDAIFDTLTEDETLGSLVLGKDPQGSWAHRTIIKPVENNEFDADFMLILDENRDWSEHPGRYIDEVHAALARHGVYKSMLKPPKCRCVRVVYAGDFHVDIVPFLVLEGRRQVIVNHDEDAWEDTNPAGFTKWLQARDEVTGNNLREVIRSMKYLRDHGGNFKRTRSVLLTAMLGNSVDAAKLHGDPGYYEDLPTTLYHVVSDLSAWLDDNTIKPSIADPSGATDSAENPVTFDHRWTESDYQNFRSKMRDVAADIGAAYRETDEATSLRLWQKVFGSEFKKPSSGVGRLGSTAGAGTGAITAPSTQAGRSG
jgi:Second Messenger Oligonucleotide or Dinucleotide Synthetase domain